MKKIFLLMIFVVTITILWSCKKDEQDATYKGQGVLFLRGPLSGNAWGSSGQYYYTDIVFSFARFPSNQTDTVITLTAQVVGDVVNYDREFAIVIDDSSTALSDEYEIVSDFTVPANSFQGVLGIKIKRAERLSSATAELRVKLVSTEDFLVNETVTALYSQKPNTTLQTSFLISWTSELVQPALWYGTFGLDYFIGGYSKKKHQMIIDLTPYADFDIFNSSTDYNPQKQVIRSTLQNYVGKYNAEHEEPLKDENGINVVIGRQSIPRP